MHAAEGLQASSYFAPTFLPVLRVDLPRGTIQHPFEHTVGDSKGVREPLLLGESACSQDPSPENLILQRFQRVVSIVRVVHFRDLTAGRPVRTESQEGQSPDLTLSALRRT